METLKAFCPTCGTCLNAALQIAGHDLSRPERVDRLNNSLEDLIDIRSRALELMDYLNKNTGPTTDWPVEIRVHESTEDDPVRDLQQLFGALSDALNCPRSQAAGTPPAV